MSDVIGQAAFWTDKNLKRIINGLEDIMAGLEGGDMKKAMERLRRVFNLMLQGFQQPDCGDFRNMIAVQPDCSNPVGVQHDWQIMARFKFENSSKSATNAGTYSR